MGEDVLRNFVDVLDAKRRMIKHANGISSVVDANCNNVAGIRIQHYTRGWRRKSKLWEESGVWKTGWSGTGGNSVDEGGSR